MLYKTYPKKAHKLDYILKKEGEKLKSSRSVPLSIMTWNIYIGADLTPLLSATPKLIPKHVTNVFRQFIATNFSKRARVIAQQIILKEPDIIGLQEVALWEFIPPYS